MKTPLLQLHDWDQSVWLDFFRRDLLISGELARMVREDGLGGVTSNPAIFEKAIADTADYDGAIAELARRGLDAGRLFEQLALEDIRGAADVLRPVYDRTGGSDGFVSLELPPRLAHDTPRSIAEARRLFGLLSRPNVMIKVPATDEGIPAIRALIADGVNVNITLLFSVGRYRQVADAYLSGLSDRAARGAPLPPVASVASFFLSRIDTLVDRQLDDRAEKMSDAAEREALRLLRGQAAIACARLAYNAFREVDESARMDVLRRQGARPQKLLWASTSTKDPRYRDTRYIEALVGPQTITTMPLATLHAFRDHGRVEEGRTLDRVAEARHVFERLAALDFDMEAVGQCLEEDGVQKFIAAWDGLMAACEHKRRAALAAPGPSPAPPA